MESDEDGEKRAAYLDPVRKLVSLQHEGFFAGTLDNSRFALRDRLLTAILGKDVDRRDRGAIRAWADQLLL